MDFFRPTLTGAPQEGNDDVAFYVPSSVNGEIAVLPAASHSGGTLVLNSSLDNNSSFQKKRRLLKIASVQLMIAAALFVGLFGVRYFFPGGKAIDFIKRSVEYNPDKLGVNDKDIGKIKFADKFIDRYALTHASPSELITPVARYDAEFFGGTAYLTTPENAVVASMAGTVSNVRRQGTYTEVTVVSGNLTTVTGMDIAGVRTGDAVRAGETIGLNLYGGAVLFTVYDNGTPVDLSVLF